MTYIRSLDGLRGIAVALVMLIHFRGLLPCGWVGVPIFYALSGFLITRILVAAKENATFGTYLGGFEARRVLRIFPIYFGYLALLVVAYLATGHPKIVPTVLPWAATYTLNVGLAFDRVPLEPIYAHFWSLSVEEQFYLVWPVVVWLASAKSLRRIVVGLVLAGPLVRGLCLGLGLSPMQIYLLTTSHLDALAAGAAVAVLDLSAIRRPARLSAALFALLLAAGLVSRALSVDPPAWSSLGYPETLPFHGGAIWGYTLIDVFAASLVLACARGELRWLESRPLVALGRISYGLYVLHRPFASVLFHVEPRLAAIVPNDAVRTCVLFAVYVAASIGLARLSFVFFETPILALRERLDLALESRAQPRATRDDGSLSA